MAVGDFNGDGIADFATANYTSGTVSIRLGQSAGTFIEPTGSPITVGSLPLPIAVGDFNGDGRTDLAVANFGSSSNSVSILLGQGNGTFTIGPAVQAGSSPYPIVVGDFNGDGFADLAVANSSSNNVIILLGKGDGTFSSIGSPITVGSFPKSMVAGDFNGDGFRRSRCGEQLF